jgi:hypothetical protein
MTIAPERVVDAEFVETADPVRTVTPNPHRVSLVASSGVLFGAAVAFLFNLHGSAASKAVNVAAVGVALGLWLVFLIRFNAHEEAQPAQHP